MLTMTTDRETKKGERVALRYFLIPLIGGIAIALAILALSMSQQVEIQPVDFRAVNISGGPATGYYDIFFALEDADGKNGPSNGYVYLKITDSNQTLLYQSESLIRSFNFSIYTNYTGGTPAVGYRWTVPVANVAAGVPLPGGLGTAEIIFLALSGMYLSDTEYIPIPLAVQ
jgi:hypothetical protein